MTNKPKKRKEKVKIIREAHTLNFDNFIFGVMIR